MNAAVLGGLVEQWVRRCQLVATQYQLRYPINLKTEVEKLVEQAERQARLLEDSGPLFLAKVESRLDITAHIAGMPEPLRPDKLTDPERNSLGRAEALHALANAFGDAADRLRPGA
jgi:hypothetical protein